MAMKIVLSIILALIQVMMGRADTIPSMQSLTTNLVEVLPFVADFGQRLGLDLPNPLTAL